MASKRTNIILAVGSIAAIVTSCCWIYYREFKAPRHNVPLHEKVGEIMAEQTARLVGPKGYLVVITISTQNEPELETQLEAFRHKLKLLGRYDIKMHEVGTKDQPKYALGAGLSGRRFVRTVKNYPKADGIVSFVGAPRLSDEEVAELTKCPRFVAETKSPEHLPKLFDKKIIQVAVASRFVFPAPGPQKPKTAQDWFEKRYQIVTSEEVRSIPAASGGP